SRLPGQPGGPSSGREPASPFVLKITDFGLARCLDKEGLTQTGDLLGTPGYMAPELTRGAGAEEAAGPAVDVYALGAVLYELLTRRPPFRAATVLETLEQVRSQEPVPPARLQPVVPRDLRTICFKCLQKQPGRRYATAQALAEDLDRFLRGEPIRARPVSRTERQRKWVRRKPALAGLLAVSSWSVAGLLLGLWRHTARLSERSAS